MATAVHIKWRAIELRGSRHQLGLKCWVWNEACFLPVICIKQIPSNNSQTNKENQTIKNTISSKQLHTWKLCQQKKKLRLNCNILTRLEWLRGLWAPASFWAWEVHEMAFSHETMAQNLSQIQVLTYWTALLLGWSTGRSTTELIKLNRKKRSYDSRLGTVWESSTIVAEEETRLPEQTVHSTFQPCFASSRQLVEVLCLQPQPSESARQSAPLNLWEQRKSGQPPYLARCRWQLAISFPPTIYDLTIYSTNWLQQSAMQSRKWLALI